MNRTEYVKFLESKGADYVWQFTKQDVNFENAFNSTKLFEEWKYISDKSKDLEEFYREKHRDYNLIDNYRTLIIAQLYGLITKEKSQYKDENITPVYKKMTVSKNLQQFSFYLSEQILKVKLPAIIDSRSETQKDRHIFPIVFIYQVLKKLGNPLSIKDLFTFVMTRNYHTDLDNTIRIIKEDNPIGISETLLKEYKSRNRVLPLLKNINLFNIDSEYISINEPYEADMDSFLKKNPFYNADNLRDKEIYKEFLTDSIGFQINLKENVIINEDFLDSAIKEDNDYVIDVNNVDIGDLDNSKINLACDKPPLTLDRSRIHYQRDAKLGKVALVNAKFNCEFDNCHSTFICRATQKNFVEAHHLIPMQHQDIFWKKYNKNIDCIQNIVSLCPICHRALHHGTSGIKKIILDKLYKIKSPSLKEIGILISKEDLNNYYF